MKHEDIQLDSRNFIEFRGSVRFSLLKLLAFFGVRHLTPAYSRVSTLRLNARNHLKDSVKCPNICRFEMQIYLSGFIIF